MQDFAPVVVHHVPPDVKEAQAVLRRREAEQARQDRIFNVKQRTIGVDAEALQAQIEAKKAALAAERERELALDNAMIATARQADVLQQEVDRIKRQQALEVMEYRAKHQPKEQRREWDLNDPDEVKKDTIPTVRAALMPLPHATLREDVPQITDARAGPRCNAGGPVQARSLQRPAFPGHGPDKR
jgi:hypothetical protein